MITPKDISKKAENKVAEVLTAWVENREIFPLIIRGDKTLTAPTFDALNTELRLLLHYSKDVKGYGYRIQLKEVDTRKLGKQKLPEAIVFDGASDFWKYIGKEKQWIFFQDDVTLIRKELPQLERWLRVNPLKVIINAGKWPGLLRVCQWFIDNPQPNCYMREIPAQPHTKFIEENKGIFESLLTELIGDSIFKGGLSFEDRFHLKTYERLIHIRLLDTKLAQYFSGVSHVGITVHDLAKLNLPCKRVIIMENKTNYSNIENFLTLPQLRDTMVIFGSGYALRDLKLVLWLKDMKIYYWGDIDAQGFEILSALRDMFSQTQSVLMNKTVYDTFKYLCSIGTKSNVTALLHLTEEETSLYQHIKGLLDKNRLEQERIPHEFVLQSFMDIFDEK